MIGGTIIEVVHEKNFRTDDGKLHRLPHIRLTVQEEGEGPTETIRVHPTNRVIERGFTIWGNGDVAHITPFGRSKREFAVARLRVQWDGKLVEQGG